MSGGEVLRGFVHDLGFAIDGSCTVWRTSVRARLPVVVSPADRYDALQAENQRLQERIAEMEEEARDAGYERMGEDR